MKQKGNSGSILVTIMVFMIFLSLMIMGLMVLTSSNLVRARARLLQLQAQYSAESGADMAIAKLNDVSNPNADAYTGTGGSEVTVLTTDQYRSTFKTVVEPGADLKERYITSTGYLYSPKSATKPTHIRKIRVTAQRSSTTSASSLRRSVINVSSAVKNIKATDIYVNESIIIAKNSTALTAENVTVVGHDTSSKKCSISGSGELKKPDVFELHPEQTRSVYKLGFNNCITPPGNTSNTNFEIKPNQTDIHTIQSMRIPWSQYMNSDYQPSPSGCTDWISGSSPRDIPSTGNDKKTHYPDSSSNVATTCGTNGDIDLGKNIVYNLRNSAHVRANFCNAKALCDPIFNNPSSEIKYLFVEGRIYFGSIRTVDGSGPIVIVTYGSDNAPLIGKCAYGDSLYLGKTNIDSHAPKLYLLATYGVCLDKTKFASPPSLGGVGGKSIDVVTNSGNPWDLYLDPTFPVDKIPIDLMWRQTGYQRL